MSNIPAVKKAYFLTGEPGVGKTTIIKHIVSRISKRAGGFYTEEIRDHGIRRGFRIITLDGIQATLAHSDIISTYHISKYGVELSSIDETAVPAIKEAIRSRDIVVIDEIGKMELFSSSFTDAVIEALDSDKHVLGTIMRSPHPWADVVKQRADVEIATVTRANRNEVSTHVLAWVESL
ncbi:MAG: NTPase [Chloroflexota bacterium]|nr:NTPase [Chloroflexota bacterium]